MNVETFYFKDIELKGVDEKASLVLFAFSRVDMQDNYLSILTKYFPTAQIVLFSTSGHFIGDQIEDAEALVAVINLEKSRIETKLFRSSDYSSDTLLGEAIGHSVQDDAKCLLLISDGSLINGTELINGLNDHIHKSVKIVGGMAGDGARFEKTFVGLNAVPETGVVATIAFYGENLEINSNHDAAWSSLGLEFRITESERNLLIGLNNKNAYSVLREFMDSDSDESFTRDMLYYPFFLEDNASEGVIRTPIAVDHVKKSITYAGNMPIGSTVKLMKSRTMQLLDSTMNLANTCHDEKASNQFVLAISCIGRRVVLEEMANEEFTELANVFGKDTHYFGFYSYGEFSRSGLESNCKLHNQTLTLAIITEN